MSGASVGIVGAASYSYDGNGMRVVKSVQGGTTTVSFFSGNSVIAEYDNGAAPASPSREYIYNPAGGDTTKLLAMISGGATTYYHQDHLSARLTTDASGNILTQEGHFPFGEQWYQSGSGNKWLFTSYQRDSESGLDYALARYYDSRTGTFCSADPLAGSPGDPQSWNRYSYGRNDPIDVTDPNGKGWVSLLLDGLGLLATAFAPEIDAFLGNEFGALFGGSGSAAGSGAGDIAEPVLHTRDEVAAVTNIGSRAVDATGEPIVTANADGGMVGDAGAGMAAASNALEQERKNKFNKQPCQHDLQALGTTPAEVQAGMKNAQLIDGTGNNTPMSSLFANRPELMPKAIAQYGNHTVGQFFAANPTYPAASQLLGHITYINPPVWARGAMYKNFGDMIHEVTAHNVAGRDDQEALTDLGYQSTDHSEMISSKLGNDCAN